MTAELQFLEAWIPERMEPGTVFLLEGPNSLGHGNSADHTPGGQKEKK